MQQGLMLYRFRLYFISLNLLNDNSVGVSADGMVAYWEPGGLGLQKQYVIHLQIPWSKSNLPSFTFVLRYHV